ncbi:hypothetical protein KCH_67180 [Kitasatospora cheerisanensis KCTC 2395]|uniref:Uncharacterized protein n=1 Tax=Kitasatospora cheerisanensis KCTC 2395 TaxID=1348663 RepID=A0A066YU69_9ACTN|nr:hypothetical protein KCH_67180 [Kitasatospora cheerisanensis KCTC 2395]
MPCRLLHRAVRSTGLWRRGVRADRRVGGRGGARGGCRAARGADPALAEPSEGAVRTGAGRRRVEHIQRLPATSG